MRSEVYSESGMDTDHGSFELLATSIDEPLLSLRDRHVELAGTHDTVYSQGH